MHILIILIFILAVVGTVGYLLTTKKQTKIKAIEPMITEEDKLEVDFIPNLNEIFYYINKDKIKVGVCTAIFRTNFLLEIEALSISLEEALKVDDRLNLDSILDTKQKKAVVDAELDPQHYREFIRLNLYSTPIFIYKHDAQNTLQIILDEDYDKELENLTKEYQNKIEKTL